MSHAKDPGVSAPEVLARAQALEDRGVARHRKRDGERLRAADKRAGLLLAIAGWAGLLPRCGLRCSRPHRRRGFPGRNRTGDTSTGSFRATRM